MTDNRFMKKKNEYKVLYDDGAETNEMLEDLLFVGDDAPSSRYVLFSSLHSLATSLFFSSLTSY